MVRTDMVRASGRGGKKEENWEEEEAGEG